MQQRIGLLNEISPVVFDTLSSHVFEVVKGADNLDGIIVRSKNLLEMELDKRLLAIVRAGVGYNNIPVERCSDAGIVAFNTPGANANAVAELVIAALLLASRDIVGGINWSKGLLGNADDIPAAVEKGKNQFVGPELRGKKLGVVALGAIGTLVANAGQALGMEVIGFDPSISVENAWRLSRATQRAVTLEELVSKCDYITIHMPLVQATRGMFNADLLKLCKPNVALINLARAELIDSDAAVAMLNAGNLRRYVTDFPTESLLKCDKVVCIPHLGASTPESEENCAVMAAEQMASYLTIGSIKNSVNYPDCDLPPVKVCRIVALHLNVPNMVSAISAEVASRGINIDNMINKSRGRLAITVLDLDEPAPSDLYAKLVAIPDVTKARIISR